MQKIAIAEEAACQESLLIFAKPAWLGLTKKFLRRT